MKEVKKFVLGRDKIPDWFNEQAQAGRVRLNVDDSGELLNAVVHQPTRRVVAGIGDTMILSKSGILVVPKEKAQKYMPEGRKDAVPVKETVQ